MDDVLLQTIEGGVVGGSLVLVFQWVVAAVRARRAALTRALVTPIDRALAPSRSSDLTVAALVRDGAWQRGRETSGRDARS